MDKTKKKKAQKQEPNIWLSALTAGGIGLAVIFAVMLIIPAIIITAENPKAYVSMGAIFCCLAGGITSGIISANLFKGAEIQTAAISSGIIILPLIILSFALGKGFNILWFGIIIPAVVLSALGGALFIKKASLGKKRNMKKFMKKR